MSPPKEPPSGFDEPTKCRSCGAVIHFARTQNGKLTPLNVTRTTVYLFNADLGGWITATGHISHFATCPDASAWRKKEARDPP